MNSRKRRRREPAWLPLLLKGRPFHRKINVLLPRVDVYGQLDTLAAIPLTPRLGQTSTAIEGEPAPTTWIVRR